MRDDQPNEKRPDHDPARHDAMPEVDGGSNRELTNLASARGIQDAALIMEAEYGCQILLTCPVKHVLATEDVLYQLLADLDSIERRHGFVKGARTPCQAEMLYAIRAVGSDVCGGMGGGVVVDGVWVHDRILEKGWKEQIVQVISGERSRLAPDSEKHCVARPSVSIDGTCAQYLEEEIYAQYLEEDDRWEFHYGPVHCISSGTEFDADALSSLDEALGWLEQNKAAIQRIVERHVEEWEVSDTPPRLDRVDVWALASQREISASFVGDDSWGDLRIHVEIDDGTIADSYDGDRHGANLEEVRLDLLKLRLPERRLTKDEVRARFDQKQTSELIEILAEPRFQEMALNALKSRVGDIRSEIHRALTHENVEIRAGAVELLGESGQDESAVTQLVERLRDPSPYVRGAAAQALKRMGPAAARAIPALDRIAAEAPEEHVRQAATDAAGNIRRCSSMES